MRAVVQRVERAQVSVEKEIVGKIGKGILLLLGITARDTTKDADYLVDKVINLRIFDDEEGKMNRSLLDCQGELLVVSQFTLFGDCRRGRRPSYTDAAAPQQAAELYNYFVTQVRQTGMHTETGIFQAMMAVELVNDGPVTLLLDSHKLF